MIVYDGDLYGFFHNEVIQVLGYPPLFTALFIWHPDDDGRSFIGYAADGAAAPGKGHPRFNIAKPQAGILPERRFYVEAPAIVPDGHLQPFGEIAEANIHCGSLRMFYNVLQALLDDPEQDQFLLLIHVPLLAFHLDLRQDNPCLIEPFRLAADGRMNAEGAQPVTAQASGHIPEIVHGLAYIFFYFVQHIPVHLVALVHDIDLYLGQAEDLSYIVMDLLADVIESQLLDLQPGLQQLIPELRFQFLFLQEIPALLLPVISKEGNNEKEEDAKKEYRGKNQEVNIDVGFTHNARF